VIRPLQYDPKEGSRSRSVQVRWLHRFDDDVASQRLPIASVGICSVHLPSVA
jgi:hypothetical protein